MKSALGHGQEWQGSGQYHEATRARPVLAWVHGPSRRVLPTAPLPSRLPAQRGAQLCGVLRIRARRALALAQLKPGVEAAARGERHAGASAMNCCCLALISF